MGKLIAIAINAVKGTNNSKRTDWNRSTKIARKLGYKR